MVKIFLGLFLLLAILLGGYYFLTKLNVPPYPSLGLPAQQGTSPGLSQSETSPTPLPLTAQNVDSTLNQTNQEVDQDATQLDKDLNSLNQIDTSQDNPSNL